MDRIKNLGIQNAGHAEGFCTAERCADPERLFARRFLLSAAIAGERGRAGMRALSHLITGFELLLTGRKWRHSD
jgi:hypothetical protein